MAATKKFGFLLRVLLFLATSHLSQGVDFTSSLVFDAEFYVNSQSLWEHGIHTEAAAKLHWLAMGIAEGRQGCGSFHSKQYLLRYPDLQKAFGTHYKLAVEHYLTHGHSEGRLGYLEGGYGGRWTISNGHDLFISASGRMAGAVDSLVWNNKEFINAFDHGRELQMATNTNPWGECFNPTEAGGRDDNTSASTSSQLKRISAQGFTLETLVDPAFWLRPGDNETRHSNSSPCANNHPTLNTEVVYPYPLYKKVTVGCVSLFNCIRFDSNFTIGGHWPNHTSHNFEAPTGYLTGEFSVISSVDPHTLQIKGYNSRLPVLMSTPDHSYAMGVWAPAGQDTDQYQYYGAMRFGSAFASGTNKWNAVFRKNAFPDGSTHTMHYVAYLCVGNVTTVTSCLGKVIQAFPNV